MIRRNYRSNRFHRGGILTSEGYSKLKDSMEFEGLCYDMVTNLRFNEYKIAIKLLDKIIAGTASEEEIRKACRIIDLVGMYAQTLADKANAVNELATKLSKTASLRRRL